MNQLEIKQQEDEINQDKKSEELLYNTNFKKLSLIITISGDIKDKIKNYKYNINTKLSSKFSEIYIPTKIKLNNDNNFNKKLFKNITDYKSVFINPILFANFIKSNKNYIDDNITFEKFIIFLKDNPKTFINFLKDNPNDIIFFNNNDDTFNEFKNTILYKDIIYEKSDAIDKDLVIQFMKKHPEFFEKLIELDKDNKYISIIKSQEALDIFLEKHKKYKLAYLENNKSNKQKKDEITQDNAKFLIEQFLSSTEPFYIKCNKFSIESSKDIKCNIYEEVLIDLSRNILSKPELKNKIEQAEKEKLKKERKDLLKKFNYELNDTGTKKLDNISEPIKISDLKNYILNSNLDSNILKSDQTLLNDRINNNIENKNKILINNRNNEAYIKEKAKNKIIGYYATDKIKNYKEQNNFNIEYEYDTGKGIIVIINNNDAQYQFCSITLELKISGINKFNKTKCNNNKKNLLIKWATYCKTKKKSSKSSKSSKSFIELLCEDTANNHIPKITVPTIASLKEQCSNITALPPIKEVNKKLGGNTKKYKKQTKHKKYKKQKKTRKHQYKKQKKNQKILEFD